MFYFEGCSCSCCGEKFTASDDVVTCPVCGTPHHRSCYKENGGCVNEALHDEGYVWSRTEDDESGSRSSEGGGTVCGVCGAENSNGRLYCCNCGKPLFSDEAGVGTEDSPGYEHRIEEIPLKDFSRFIGPSGVIYAPMFHQMYITGKKVSFNIIGLILPSFWYLNRKMYVHGISILLYNLLSNFFSMFFYTELGLIYNAAASFDSESLMELMGKCPVAFYGSLLFGLGSYAIAILSALFSNRLYLNWSIKRIRKLRKANPDNDAYIAALERNGRSNFGLVIIIILVYFIATMLMGRLF